MKRRLATTAAVILIAAVLAACGGAGPSPSPTPATFPEGLAGRTFLSTVVNDNGTIRQLVPGTRIRLAFGPTDLAVSAGCNMIGGQYRLEDGRLIFTGTSMTEMACDADRDAQDQWVMSFLNARPVVKLDAADLALEAGGVRIGFTDQVIQQPIDALTGRSWVVTGIITGDVASSIPAGVTASLSFDASGPVDVDAGCNTGTGAWYVTPGHLEIKELAMTKKACPPPTGQVETTILEILGSGPLAWQIDQSSMTLMAEGRGLQLQAPGLD